MNASISPSLLPIPPCGALIVRHYKGGQPLRISWDDFGILKSIEAAASNEDTNIWIAPGLVDLQVNGYDGVDFQREEAISEASLLQAVRALRRDGCYRFFLTLITTEWPKLLSRIGHYRSLIHRHPELRRAIAGWHLEGPFLSDQPGFSGAHNPAWMMDPSAQHIQQLSEVTAGDKVLLTLAGERPNADVAIAEAVRCGFVVSLGHTNSNEAETRNAVAAGARGFTHLANGCPQQFDRHQNVLWNAIDEELLTAGLIADGIHVSPKLFRILHRAMDPKRIYWTTDAMAAAGAPPGNYTLGELELVVGQDTIVRNPKAQGFAGSALTPFEGIRRGAKMLGKPWQEVWDFFSVNPAIFMGLPAELAPGSPAGFCLLRSE